MLFSIILENGISFDLFITVEYKKIVILYFLKDLIECLQVLLEFI